MKGRIVTFVVLSFRVRCIGVMDGGRGVSVLGKGGAPETRCIVGAVGSSIMAGIVKRNWAGNLQTRKSCLL